MSGNDLLKQQYPELLLIDNEDMLLQPASLMEGSSFLTLSSDDNGSIRIFLSVDKDGDPRMLTK